MGDTNERWRVAEWGMRPRAVTAIQYTVKPAQMTRASACSQPAYLHSKPRPKEHRKGLGARTRHHDMAHAAEKKHDDAIAHTH